MKIKSILPAIIQIKYGKHLEWALYIFETMFYYRKMFEQYIQMLLMLFPAYISITCPIKMLVSIIAPTRFI